MSYDIGTARGVIEMDYNGRGISQAVSDLDNLEGRGTRVSKGMGLAAKAVAGIGLTVAGAFAFAVKKTAEFEHQMSAIEAVSGASETQMEALRAKALQLGADTAFSASEAASAMEELVKAGLSVDEVLNGAADAAVALAAAGGIDIPQAATIASNAMNQFNLDAADLTGVVDNIAGAANASAIDVSQLGTSLSQVGAVANLAGLSFEDTATAIALMGNAGIVGSDAGTSLKTMLQNLQPVTTKQMALFKELGILTEDGSNKFFDAEGNVKSYAGVAGVLSKALQGQTQQQKLMTLETMFGTDAIRAAAVAADAGAKGVHKLNDEMNETSAAEVAAKRMDNFSGSLDQLWGSIETAVITGGSGLLVYLRDIVDWLTKTINAGVKVGGVLSDELGPGFDSLFNAIGNVLGVAIDIIGVLSNIGEGLGGLGLGVAIGLFTELADILEFVTGLLEGQEAVIMIVLGAWILLANGGIAVVAARLGWFAAYGVVKALDGLIALQGAAATTSGSLTALAATASAAAASLGAVALLVAAIIVWNAYKAAVEETDEALASAAKTKREGNTSALSAEIDSMRALIGERKALIKEYQGDDLGTVLNNAFNPTRWDDVAKLDEANDSMGALEATTSDLEATFQVMGEGLTDIAVSMGMLDSGEAEALMNAFAEGDPAALEKMDTLLTQLQPLLDQAGISADEFMGALKGDDGSWLDKGLGNLPPTLGVIKGELNSVASNADGAKGATQSLADAAEDFGNEAMTAADKADALKDAMDALIGVHIGAEEAGIRWREGLRSLTEQIESTNGAINTGTAEADANKSAILDQIDLATGRVEAAAREGAGIGKLTALYRDQRKALIDHAVEAGADRDAVRDLVNEMGLTPESVRTLVQAVGVERAQTQIEKLAEKYNLAPKMLKTIFETAGADTAKEKVEALRDAIKEIKGKNAPMAVPGTPEAEQQVKDLKKAIDILKGKDANINTPGAAFARDQVAALRAEIERLRDKEVTITYVKRTVGGGFGPMAGDGIGSTDSSGKTTTGTTPKTIIPDGMLPGPGPKTPSAPGVGTLPAPKSASGSGDSGRVRMLDGELRLDPSGRAFITGLATLADDDDADYEDTLGRMGRR